VLPRRSKVEPQPDPSVTTHVATEYLRLARLYKTPPQVPAQSMLAKEMELYFDFEAAS
jgi:hypothetical protein